MSGVNDSINPNEVQIFAQLTLGRFGFNRAQSVRAQYAAE